MALEPKDAGLRTGLRLRIDVQRLGAGAGPQRYGHEVEGPPTGLIILRGPEDHVDIRMKPLLRYMVDRIRYVVYFI